MHELYKDLHHHKNKDKQDSWVCKKSDMKLVTFTSYANLQNYSDSVKFPIHDSMLCMFKLILTCVM